jgi:hypothetical protein
MPAAPLFLPAWKVEAEKRKERNLSFPLDLFLVRIDHVFRTRKESITLAARGERNKFEMLFSRDAASGLADGTITLTFRTWSRPQAREGGRYRTWGLLLEVDTVSRVDPASIGDGDARRAGFPSADVLRQKLGAAENQVWRIEFRCVGADDRIARRGDSTLDTEKLAKLETRLARFDQASPTGPWTRSTLQLIASNPGVVSTILARRANLDRMLFKRNVRKLKELGLTESLDVGYRLSALGKAFVDR